jgi:hypothetical protein
VQTARIERELLHPIGGLEGYTPAEVHAEQLREELARRFELPTRKPDRAHAVAHHLCVDGYFASTRGQPTTTRRCSLA